MAARGAMYLHSTWNEMKFEDRYNALIALAQAEMVLDYPERYSTEDTSAAQQLISNRNTQKMKAAKNFEDLQAQLKLDQEEEIKIQQEFNRKQAAQQERLLAEERAKKIKLEKLMAEKNQRDVVWARNILLEATASELDRAQARLILKDLGL